jgi:hypothetical protein
VDFERVWQENISGVSYPRENEEPSVGGGVGEDNMRRQQQRKNYLGRTRSAGTRPRSNHSSSNPGRGEDPLQDSSESSPSIASSS